MNLSEQLILDYKMHSSINIQDFIIGYMLNEKLKLKSPNFSKRSFYNGGLSELLARIEQYSPIESQNIYPHIFCIINSIDPKCEVCNTKLDGSHYRSDNGGRMMMCCSATCSKSKTGKSIHYNKTKKSVQDKYGVDNVMHDEGILNIHKEASDRIDWNARNKKSEMTNMERLGVKFPMQDAGVILKRQKTFLDRYGVKEISERYDIVGSKNPRNIYYNAPERPWNNPDLLRKMYIDDGLSTTEIGITLGLDSTSICDRFRKFGIEMRGYAKHSISSGERELLAFITEHYDGEIKRNYSCEWNRFDLDIYLPDIKLAFEYDGIYWHSSGGVGRRDPISNQVRKHLNQDSTYNQDINLINIFEDEWIQNKDKVKKFILSKISNVHSDRIYARKCTLKLQPLATSNKFYDDNHLQGGTGIITFSLSLVSDGEIQSMMSFNCNNGIELVRYAHKRNVVGGFKKLLKNSIKHIQSLYNDPLEIKSFLDIAKFNLFDNIYIKNGFKLQTIIKPDYMVVVNNTRRHKFSFRKKKLITMCIDKCIELTGLETEFMLHDKLGIHRIYDAGKARYILRIPNE